MSKKGYIYKYTFPDGRVYIGETRVSVEKCHYQHMSASKNPERWNIVDCAIAYYGEPTLETIETIEVSDHEEAKLKELLRNAKEKWIKYYDSTVESGKGFNVRGTGKRMSWVEFLLNEKMFEIYEDEKWEEQIDFVDATLDSIGTKICIKKETLTREEEKVWNDYKFREYDYWDNEVGVTSFSSFYERHKAEGEDWGDIPYEILEIIDSKSSSRKEKEEANRVIDKCFYDNTMRDAMKQWINDIRQTIWEKVKEEEKELVRLKDIADERKREGIERASFKRNMRILYKLKK